jgi:hypothetical protein
MATRDEIIAHWHERLGAADGPPGIASDGSLAQGPWIMRLQKRLYRFLLSLYGDGRWNAPQDLGSLPPAEARPPVNDQTGEARPVPLVRTPAKEESRIRAVLKEVSNAREQPLEQGPLAGGFDRATWVVVASARQHIDPLPCGELLKAHGIVPCIIGRDGDVTVAVRALQAAEARRLIGAAKRRLRPRAVKRAEPGLCETALRRAMAAGGAEFDRLPLRWQFVLLFGFYIGLTLPIAWVLVAAVTILQSGPRHPFDPMSPPFLAHFWLVWRGVLLTTLLVVWTRWDRRRRRLAAARKTLRR